MMSHIVVKVGGSLFDWPELGPRLRAFLGHLGAPALIVPGGGPLADAVRDLDVVHRLGEETSHWLALRSLSVSAALLNALLPGATVIDPYQFAREDESRPGCLPHSWEATSDSLAARVARVTGARQLILLKSADPPVNWREDAAYVDPQFAKLVVDAPFALDAVNLRDWRAT